MDERRVRKYGLKNKAPLFDPCKKCIIKSCCSEFCKNKILFNIEKLNNIIIIVELPKKKRKDIKNE